LKIIEKRSNGKIQPKTFAAQSLHASTDGFKACVNNITDMTHGYPVWQPGSFHLAHIMDLPFAFPPRCYYVGSRVGEELYAKYFKKEYENCGVYIANYHVMSPYQLISRKPISELKHLKGLKIRVPTGPQTEMMKLLGAVPVYMTTAETYSAFQKGIVDAVFLYDGSFTNFRLYEIGKYKTGNLGMSTAGVPFALNRKWFDALPKDLKKVFYDSMRICSQVAAMGFEATDEVARKQMEKAGVKTIDFSPTERKAFQDAISPVWNTFVAENEKLGLPAKKLVEDLKALSEKYSTWTPQQIIKLTMEKPISGMIDGM
jgi:TRAP-type C4-dicarboxylate transport system substrate-binding protein